MEAGSRSAGLVSRDRAVRAIVSSHRALTRDCGGIERDDERATLVACSGGADSVALAVALSSTRIPVIVGHVVHDVRPESEAFVDRDHARSVAARLGVRFVESSVRVRGLSGNTEANARRVRYAALMRLAADAGVAFVATAHHADDVLETLLMRLMRGAGPRGLSGPAPYRRLRIEHAPNAQDIWLVRPMLGISRADAERICGMACGGAGLSWTHDRTNDDQTLLRNAVRARVIPILRELSPGVETRAGRAAELLREATRLLDERAAAILGQASRANGTILFARDLLAEQPRVVLGDVLRSVVVELTGGAGLDRVPGSEIGRAVQAIRDGRGDVRTFGWGDGARVRVEVLRDRVIVSIPGGEHGGKADRSCGTLRP